MKTKIHIITCPTFGDALSTILHARRCGLSCAYLPHGGIDAHRDTPVTHRVPIMGTSAKIENFLKGEPHA